MSERDAVEENARITITETNKFNFISEIEILLTLHGDAYEQPHNFISFIKPTIKLNNAVINSN